VARKIIPSKVMVGRITEWEKKEVREGTVVDADELMTNMTRT